MGTPRGAEHRDLEERFRKLERQVRDLVGAALRRDQLGVSQGDFVVTGGGDVVVQDGGSLRAEYASGRIAAEFGELEDGGATEAYGVRVFPDEDAPPGISNALLEAWHNPAVGQVVRSYADGFVSFKGGDGVIMSAGPLGGSSDAMLLVQADGTDLIGGASVHDRLTYFGIPTTSLAANLRYDTDNGVIKLVTSSERYKADVRDAEVDPAEVLRLQGRTWRDRAEVEADPDTERRHVGFIAEEVHDAGLTDLVEYDAEGRPEALQYDRFSVALLELAKSQQQQIADLTERVARLESADQH